MNLFEMKSICDDNQSIEFIPDLLSISLGIMDVNKGCGNAILKYNDKCIK